jgi:hypothetical protein
MSEKSIPDLVLATLRMHAAKAEMDLVRTTDELDRTTVATARSRVLRHLRGQLTAQRDAWEYLTSVANLLNAPEQEVNDTQPAPRVMCTICAHDPHGSDGCGAGCGCDGTGQQVPPGDQHRFRGCTGAWEVGSDGISRKCADCKEPLYDLVARG